MLSSSDEGNEGGAVVVGWLRLLLLLEGVSLCLSNVFVFVCGVE